MGKSSWQSLSAVTIRKRGVREMAEFGMWSLWSRAHGRGTRRVELQDISKSVLEKVHPKVP
jgi:hypothetical protein